MANKHLSEDEIKYVISADSSRAQQELHKLGKSTAALRREEKARRSAMIELEATGKKNSEQYQKLKQECKEYTQQIADNEAEMKKLRSALDVSAMTMNQLRKYAKDLSSELNNTSKAASPQQYAELESRLQGVNARMEELKVSARSYKEIISNNSTINYLAGNLLTKGAELTGRFFRKITDGISEIIDKSVELAESADGITHAFDKIATRDYLQTLRTATKGTVSDIELMKAAVKAKDFRIPLEDLGKYLSFAQLKAQQTGQSLDYMVDSIVTGLGRKSPMILDNLGLSAAEIGEQTKKTGDFMKGVASIVEKQLAAAGETYISATDRAEQRTVALENAQKDLGDVLLPLKEDFADAYGQIQLTLIKTIKYMVEHRDTLFALGKVVALLVVTYTAYISTQKLAHLWSLRAVAVGKLKAAAMAVENTMLELSVLRHAVLNKTMTKSIALQKAFNIVLKLSPWGLVLGGITLVVGALLMFGKRTDAAARAQKRLTEVKKEAISRVAEEKSKIDLLVAAARDEKMSMDERRKAVAELNRIIPNYNAQLDETTGKYKENKKALDAYLSSLVRKYEIEAAKEELAKLSKAAWLAKKEMEKANKALADTEGAKGGYTYTTSWGTTGNTKQDLVDRARKRAGSAQAEYKRSEEDKKAFIDSFGQDLKQDAVRQTQGESKVTGTVGAELDRIKKKIDELQAKRLTIKVGDTKGLKDLDNQIAALEKRKASLEYKSGTGKKKEKSNPDQLVAKDFAHDRSQDLDTARRAYEDDLNALKEALAKKKLTQEQYNAYVSALNIQHQNNLLVIEESYWQRAQGLQMKEADKKKALLEQQDKATVAQRQAASQAYIDAEKQYYDALEKIQQSAPGNPQTLQQECDAKLRVLDGYYQASLQLAVNDAERQKQLTESYEAAKAAITAEYARKQQEERARARQEFGLDTFEDQYAAQAAKRKEAYDNGVIDKQQYDRAMDNLDQQAEEHRLQIRQQYGLATQQELYNAELEQLKMHLQNKEISETEYEEAVKNLKIAKMKETFDYYSNLTSGAMQALQQAEEANVEAKYDAEIEAARNAGKDTTELEKKKANEKLKIQKKYADVNFAIQAAQIIASTAAAIAKTFSELGFPAGIPAAALMSATGTAQLAAALAERNKVKKMTMQGTASSTSSGARVATGLESGGSIDVEREQDGRRFHAAYEPNRRGFVDKPTVIVGEGPYGRSKEWVASNAAVDNPTVAPILDIIDRAQRAGTIRTLDMNKFLVQQAAGRATGGAVDSPVAHPAPLTTSSTADRVFTRLADVLDRISEEGIPAAVALDELERKQLLRERARRFGSK